MNKINTTESRALRNFIVWEGNHEEFCSEVSLENALHEKDNYQNKSLRPLRDDDDFLFSELYEMGMPIGPERFVYLSDGVWIDSDGNLHC